jgi:ribose transport system substrate-binding protein
MHIGLSWRRRPQPLGARFATFAVATGLILSACGSTSSSSGSHTATGASATTGGAPAAASSCASQAASLVAAQRAEMKPIIPQPAFDMGKNRGKSVYYISISQETGYALALSQGFTAAAKAAGMKPFIFDAMDKPELFVQGVEQAIAAHAGGIFLVSIPTSLIQAQLKQARAAGIPVLTLNYRGPSEPLQYTNGIFKVPVTRIGRNLAQYAAYATQCKAKSLVVSDPSIPGFVVQVNATHTELARLCPQCKATDVPISLATMATAAAPTVESALQRNPSTNAVLAMFDGLATYLQPSISASSSKALLISTDGNAQNLDAVRKGTQASDLAYAPTNYQGYLVIDQLGRAMLGLKTNPPAIQLQLFDHTNIPSGSSFTALWPGLVGFEQAFAKAWGL